MISDTSFSVNIFAPSAAFVATIAYTVAAVINSDLCEANRVVVADDPNTTEDESSDDYCNAFMDHAPFGAGSNAWIVTQWARETRTVLEPNWMYWESGDFAINRYVYETVDETQTRVLDIQDKEVDLAYIPPALKG